MGIVSSPRSPAQARGSPRSPRHRRARPPHSSRHPALADTHLPVATTDGFACVALAQTHLRPPSSPPHTHLPADGFACCALGRAHLPAIEPSPTPTVQRCYEIAKLFPNVFGQPSASLVPSLDLAATRPLKVGVVLSGGQAPGGHNVICGIFDYLQERAKGSTMYGFKGGLAGVMKCKYVELTVDFVYPYINQGGFDMICSGRDKIETPEQFKQAEDTAIKLDLDGLVVIGGDDSNTNACLLGEYFRSRNMKTRVIGYPKTIDGDLKCNKVPTSFGFDTACKDKIDYVKSMRCSDLSRENNKWEAVVVSKPEGYLNFF